MSQANFEPSGDVVALTMKLGDRIYARFAITNIGEGDARILEIFGTIVLFEVVLPETLAPCWGGNAGESRRFLPR